LTKGAKAERKGKRIHPHPMVYLSVNSVPTIARGGTLAEIDFSKMFG